MCDIVEGREFHKETTDTKGKIYEKLNESEVQTEDNYVNAIVTGKGAEKKYFVEFKIKH